MRNLLSQVSFLSLVFHTPNLLQSTMPPRKITLKAQLNRAKAETQQRQQEDRFVANKYKSANKERLGEDDEEDEAEDGKDQFTGPSPQHQKQGALESLFVGFGGHQDSLGAMNDSED